MDWNELIESQIIGGKSPEGLSYLNLFLKDYTAVFPGAVNAQCPKCLQQYIRDYKRQNAMKKENKKSDYVLLEKRNGIALDFGSPIQVNNSNITNEYAETLIARFRKLNKEFTLDQLFAEYPEESEIKPKRVKKSEPSEARKKETEIELAKANEEELNVYRDEQE